jgi:hypothetical protein
LFGWKHAADLLPSVVDQMVAARGADESTEWRQPADLVALCAEASADLAAALAAGRDRGPWSKHIELTQNLLGDDPGTIIGALQAAVSEGASLADVGRSLCYAAALRVAWFGTANEHGDWETAHHVFTYCNASHQVLKRIVCDAAPGECPSHTIGEGQQVAGFLPLAARALDRTTKGPQPAFAR